MRASYPQHVREETGSSCLRHTTDGYFLTSRLPPMAEGRAALPLVRRVSPTVLGAYAVVVGLLAMVGWWADVPRLTDWTGTGLSLQPNSAVATIATGLALIALADGWRRVGLLF